MSRPTTEFVRIRHPISPPRTRVSLCAVAAAIALALVALPAAAVLYKWTDANGRVIYSDQPPNGNFKVETLNAPPPPDNPNAVKELAGKEAELQQKRLQRVSDETKAVKTQADADKKRDQCGKVRGQITMMQSEQNILLYRSNDKGEPVYMDDAGRRREREQMESWVRENCSG